MKNRIEDIQNERERHFASFTALLPREAVAPRFNLWPPGSAIRFWKPPRFIQYSTANLICPVCGKELDTVDSYVLPLDWYTCTTHVCPLNMAGDAQAWQFLHVAIDRDSDAVQEARKVMARLGARQ